MNFSFILLGIAVLILRYLAFEANATFRARLFRLFHVKTSRGHLIALLKQCPDQLREFRRRVLPYAVLQIALDSLSCALFVGALFAFPPQVIGASDMVLLQRGSVILITAALTFEVLWLGQVFWTSSSALTGEPEPE